MDTIDTICRQAVSNDGSLATFVRKMPRDVSAIHRFIVMLESWADRRRSRKALAQLSDYHLKDIGLTPSQAMEEASRSFWSGGLHFPPASDGIVPQKHSGHKPRVRIRSS